MAEKNGVAETPSSGIVRVPVRLAASELMDSEFNTVLLRGDEDTTRSSVRSSVGRYLRTEGVG